MKFAVRGAAYFLIIGQNVIVTVCGRGLNEATAVASVEHDANVTTSGG